MSLTPAQRTIVQQTFKQIDDADRLAMQFYQRLFDLDPSIRPMFQGSMAEQRTKLMQTLAVVVSKLFELDEIVPAIEQLGKRHVQYGVTREHWETVGSALIDTLDTTFGEAFTDEVRQAWTDAYLLIASTAIAAAYQD